MHDSSPVTQGTHQQTNVQKMNKVGIKAATSSTKTPPVPTLVRGSGSNLVGKKPTYMPEEVVKVGILHNNTTIFVSVY